MNQLAQARKTTLNLMARALELLDEFGEAEAAADLQQAIDTLTGAHETLSNQENETALETPAARRILARMDRRAEIRQESK